HQRSRATGERASYRRLGAALRLRPIDHAHRNSDAGAVATMEEGTLAKWHVREGDEVRTGDVIAEIETDKATMEVEAIDDGRMGKILVAEGTEHVPVNKPIALLLTDGEDLCVVSGETPSPDRGEGDSAASPRAPSPSSGDGDAAQMAKIAEAIRSVPHAQKGAVEDADLGEAPPDVEEA